jgi:hypothetical protein
MSSAVPWLLLLPLGGFIDHFLEYRIVPKHPHGFLPLAGYGRSDGSLTPKLGHNN